MDVTRRSVGVVGGVRSRAANAGETGNTKTMISRRAISAGTLDTSRIFILFTPSLKLVVYRTIRQERFCGCMEAVGRVGRSGRYFPQFHTRNWMCSCVN